MAMYLYVDGKQVIEHGTPGRCKCGEPAETKVHHDGPGGGYEEKSHMAIMRIMEKSA